MCAWDPERIEPRKRSRSRCVAALRQYQSRHLRGEENGQEGVLVGLAGS